MQHTYLRYECADAFSLTTSSSTTSTLTTSPLTFLNNGNSSGNGSNLTSSKSSPPILLSTASSQIIGFNLRTNEPCLKIGHRELLSGGLGTGKALNSNEVLCITAVSSGASTNGTGGSGSHKVATGWKDGSIRIFDINSDDIPSSSSSVTDNVAGMVHSLLFDNETRNEKKNEEFIMREPLVLNGHTNSSVTCLAFDSAAVTKTSSSSMNSASQLLASGSSDGRIILWDIIAETGLYRLIGHKGPITDLSFSYLTPPQSSNDNSNTGSNEMALISSSMDGLVKVWNMESQCCMQTIANHNGQVTSSTVLSLLNQENSNGNDNDNSGTRSRFITGCIDGKVRVWSIHSSKRMIMEMNSTSMAKSSTAATTTTTTTTTTDIDTNASNTNSTTATNTNDTTMNQDDICTYMGTLPLPPNTISNEKIQSIQHHTYNNNDQSESYIGVLRSNTKHVDIYIIRNVSETMKKKIRRLRRKREKDSASKKKKKDEMENGDGNGVRGKKRGLLEDEEDDNDDKNKEENMKMDIDNGASISTDKMLIVDDDQIKASDEFEYITTVRASHKIKAFTFSPYKEKKGGNGIRIVLALATNTMEVHSISPKKKDNDEKEKSSTATTEYDTNLVSTLDMYGHPTGIRSIALSSDDTFACTVSKNVAKVWNVNNRSCLRSLALSSKTKSKKASFYGLCVVFLPGDTHFVVGTREGHLLIVDIASGDIVYMEEKAHEKEIWSIDLKKPKPSSISMDENEYSGGAITIMTGSADKSVKFWEIESQMNNRDSDEEDDSDVEETHNPYQNHPMLVHVRTLQTTDDVIACRYSYDPTNRMVFVSTLDSQIKVYFDDTLKFFLSLYGHSLPALALDASDDDTLLASGGADKSIKIWGLDFGDTHRTLYGHSDSITDLKFVRKTHNFFTCSKDTTVRFWDGDRFEQILLLDGHSSEINCLTLSKTGAFVLTSGMDRQVRVWERTKDMVFLEEEKERALEAAFDKVEGKEERETEHVLRARKNDGEDDDDDDDENQDAPQSEAAVRKSVLSVSSGDRIMEGLERVDNELKEIAMFNTSQKMKSKEDRKERVPSRLLLGMEPPAYILWILRTIKSAELEQSLLILPLNHMERLMYYLIVLLRKGQGVEICSRTAIFLIKSHQKQIIYGGSGSSGKKSNNMTVPLRELRRLLKLRLGESRDTIGYNMAAMRMVVRMSQERKTRYHVPEENEKSADIWKGIGL